MSRSVLANIMLALKENFGAQIMADDDDDEGGSFSDDESDGAHDDVDVDESDDEKYRAVHREEGSDGG